MKPRTYTLTEDKLLDLNRIANEIAESRLDPDSGRFTRFRHDSDDRGSLVIAVYTRGKSTLDAEAGERAIAEVSRTLYDYFLFSQE